MTKPRIGTPRMYGERIDVLYPGEQARAASVHRQADGTFRVVGWLVEPAPGLKARLLRWQYRVFGRWLKSQPKIEVTLEKERVDTDA